MVATKILINHSMACIEGKLPLGQQCKKGNIVMILIVLTTTNQNEYLEYLCN